MATEVSAVTQEAISETPLAVFDCETTGLSAGADRIIEVSVVRIDPGEEPRLVFDTLINPCRRVAATEIHGITDSDVRDAPRFDEIAGDLARTLSGCVVAAYNVYFDMRFLEYELSLAGASCTPPHLCLMYLRPMLGLGSRCSLADACREHGVEYSGAHQAGTDASAAAALWPIYLQTIDERGVRTFGDLGRLKKYKFIQSFNNAPLPASVVQGLKCGARPKSRIGMPRETAPSTTTAADRVAEHVSPAERAGLAEYWESLKSVLADLKITREEMEYMARKQRELNLHPEQIRSLHGRAFAAVISQCIDDRRLDKNEVETLCSLHQCLSKLGWAPGERI
ncbi:MAG: 3'-5' exonuclease [Phycisphaerales bacterium]|nr:3'-5' exonuclease [Phycisphaerales bacterium]